MEIGQAEKMGKRGVTKLFLPSVGKARIELYFTSHSVQVFWAQYLAGDGRTRMYRIGRLCIGILGPSA